MAKTFAGRPRKRVHGKGERGNEEDNQVSIEVKQSWKDSIGLWPSDFSAINMRKKFCSKKEMVRVL